jgi:hypothetical protein
MSGFTPEVLIYIQSVKRYLDNNNEAKKYFLSHIDSDLFFEHLAKISQKNFEDNGEVMLNINQFELLRKTVLAIAASKGELKNESLEKTNLDFDVTNIFVDIGDYGKICLN